MLTLCLLHKARSALFQCKYMIIFYRTITLFFLSVRWWKPCSCLKPWGVQISPFLPFTPNAYFHCLTPSQTKGKKKGVMGGLGVWLKCSFLCAFIPFLLCTAPNAFFTSYRNLLHSYSQKKLVLCVRDLVRQSLWCRDGEGECVWVPHNNIHQPN